MSLSQAHDFGEVTGGVDAILGDAHYVGALASGGEPAEALARALTTSIEQKDKPAQEDIIKELVEALTKNHQHDDHYIRHAALTLLSDKSFAEILYHHIPALCSAYISAVRAVSDEPQDDHFFEVIDTLLSLGDRWAPFFAHGKQKDQRIKSLDTAWGALTAKIATVIDRENSIAAYRRIITHIREAQELAAPPPPLHVVARKAGRRQRIVDAITEESRGAEKRRRLTSDEMTLLRNKIVQLNHAGVRPDAIQTTLNITSGQYAGLVRPLIEQGLIRDARFRKFTIQPSVSTHTSTQEEERGQQ